MELDQFSWYQTKVKEYLDEYTLVMKKYAPDYVGYSKTINQLAQPFIKGYFTLAVVGKMSAGKSTFINALIKDKNILPTDHFQTTCTLTKIRYGDKKQVSVTYADGHKVAIENDVEIGLKKLVAIPDAYRDLPINQINKMIIDGWSQDKIIGQLDYLKEKAAKNIDLKVLKEYIKSHDQSNIAIEVIIELPLPDYKGWQIVDTPGVDAIGGIEDTTSDFLDGRDEWGNNNVDAVVFVHSGKWQIEDGSFNSFVKKTYDLLTDNAKKRMFFVITHASDSDFMNHKDKNIDNAIKLFVDKYRFDKKRLVCVDSLLSLLYTYIDNEGIQAQLIPSIKNTPIGWQENEWKACKELVRKIKGHLEDDEKDQNNENILNLMKDISGFSSFREKINEFVKTEKEKAFKDFVQKMTDDLDQCIFLKKNDLTLCEKNRDQSEDKFRQTIEDEKTKILKAERDLNICLGEIRSDFPRKSSLKIDSIRESINKLEAYSDKDSLEQESVRINRALDRCQEDLFRDLSSLIDEKISARRTYNKVSFELPDCESIFNLTKSVYTETIEHKNKVKAPGFTNLWKRVFYKDADAGYKITYTLEEKYKADEHLKDVIGKIQVAFRVSLQQLRELINARIEKAGVLISDELKKKLDDQYKKLSKYETNRDNSVEQHNMEIGSIVNIITKLTSLQTEILGDVKL